MNDALNNIDFGTCPGSGRSVRIDRQRDRVRAEEMFMDIRPPKWHKEWKQTYLRWDR